MIKGIELVTRKKGWMYERMDNNILVTRKRYGKLLKEEYDIRTHREV